MCVCVCVWGENNRLSGAVPQLVEEGRARMTESKRQLHTRIMRNKDPNGFSAFGLILNELSIEVYAMVVDPDDFSL